MATIVIVTDYSAEVYDLIVGAVPCVQSGDNLVIDAECFDELIPGTIDARWTYIDLDTM